MENSNVRESPISRDTLLITDAEYGVKWRVSKLSYLNVPCDSRTMSSLFHRMMEIYLEPNMQIQMM